MNQYDVLVIGSGPAAWSSAITARKRNLRCLVVAAKAENNWLWKAEKVENYPGMPSVSGRTLLETFRKQAEDAGAIVVENTARQLQKTKRGYMALCGNDIITTSAVILCIGAARPRLLPGEEELLGQGISWCGTCDGMFYRGKKVAVLSYWNGGVEEAAFLSTLASSVDYYVMAPHSLNETMKATIMKNRPESVARNDEGKISLVFDEEEIDYDGVFVFRPAVNPVSLLPGLEMDGTFIRVNRNMQTNMPFVYAAGDCTGQPLQIAKAVGEGNVAAISAAEDIAKEGHQ